MQEHIYLQGFVMKKIFLLLFLILTTTSVVEARCDTTGVVKGLDYYGDNFLSVRSGPDSSYREIDRIYSGDRVRICRWSRGGNWLNIRYYDGREGWVFHRYIRVRYE